MTIQVDNALPPNVVEIGNEITQGVVDGLMSASPSASSSNPYITVNGVSGVYLPLAGGTMTGDIGVNYNDLNQVTSIVFADSTVQTTASVGAGTWGSITGTLSSQTDLQSALNAKLTASSNLSDLANTATARTNLGVAYATDAETGAGLSTSTVISPNTLSRLVLQRKITSLQGGLQSQTLGTGFGLTQLTTYNNLNIPNNTSGFVRGYINSPFSIPNFAGFGTPWQMGIGFQLSNSTLPIYNGQILIVRYGEPFTPTAGVAWTENPTAKRIGFKYVLGGSNTIKLQVHNGTTYTEVDSGYVPANISNNGNHYFVFGSDGVGNVTLTIWKPDGTTVTCSTANGPTGAYQSGGNTFGYQASIAGTTTTGLNLGPTHPIIQIGY